MTELGPREGVFSKTSLEAAVHSQLVSSIHFDTGDVTGPKAEESFPFLHQRSDFGVNERNLE